MARTLQDAHNYENIEAPTRLGKVARSPWEWLNAPDPNLTDPIDKRRSSLFATLMLSLMLLAIVIIGFIYFFYKREYLEGLDIQVLIAMGGVALAGYILNRRGNFRIGAYVFIAYSTFATTVSPFLPNFYNGENLVFIMFPVLLAALILSVRAGIIVTASSTIAVLALSLVLRDVIDTDVHIDRILLPLFPLNASLIAYMIQMQVIERMRRRELEIANEALRRSEIVLEKRVQERTAELEVAMGKAEEANRVKSQFLASVSHELRTPLNGIINFSSFVAQGIFGEVNEKQKNALLDVGRNADHLLALINDVLDISKIESGSLKLFIEENISFNTELETVLKTAETLIVNRPIALNLDVDENLPVMRGDRRRIRQIMLNILSNAAKFTEEGSITVRAHHEDDVILFSVTDTGVGIAPEDHETVFETFKQTESGLRSGAGTGLGMPISRKLAQAHGGDLWLESEVDKGSTFFVRLPLNAVEVS